MLSDERLREIIRFAYSMNPPSSDTVSIATELIALRKEAKRLRYEIKTRGQIGHADGVLLAELQAELERLRGAWVEGPPTEPGEYWVQSGSDVIPAVFTGEGYVYYLDEFADRHAIILSHTIRHAKLTQPKE